MKKPSLSIVMLVLMGLALAAPLVGADLALADSGMFDLDPRFSDLLLLAQTVFAGLARRGVKKTPDQ